MWPSHSCRKCEGLSYGFSKFRKTIASSHLWLGQPAWLRINITNVTSVTLYVTLYVDSKIRLYTWFCNLVATPSSPLLSDLFMAVESFPVKQMRNIGCFLQTSTSTFWRPTLWYVNAVMLQNNCQFSYYFVIGWMVHVVIIYVFITPLFILLVLL